MSEDKLTSFFNRARFLFRFGIVKLKKIAEHKEDAVEFIKKEYYEAKIKEINFEKQEKIEYLKKNNSTVFLESYLQLSKQIFKQALINRYANQSFEMFDNENYRLKFERFLHKHPVVYSTTHSIRYCSAENYLYDYIIIDEASQVDLVTAVLAFSCAKRVVLVGDDNQITHVVNSKITDSLDSLFNLANLNDCYDYKKNNVMKSTLLKYPNIKKLCLMSIIDATRKL